MLGVADTFTTSGAHRARNNAFHAPASHAQVFPIRIILRVGRTHIYPLKVGLVNSFFVPYRAGELFFEAGDRVVRVSLRHKKLPRARTQSTSPHKEFTR